MPGVQAGDEEGGMTKTCYFCGGSVRSDAFSLWKGETKDAKITFFNGHEQKETNEGRVYWEDRIKAEEFAHEACLEAARKALNALRMAIGALL